MKMPISHFCPLHSTGCSSLVSTSGCTSSTMICPTCKAASGTKHAIGMSGTQQCSTCFRRRWEEGSSLMPAGISTRHHHWAHCFVSVPLWSEAADSWWLQAHCLLTQSQRRSVLELQVKLHGCYRNYNAPMIRENIQPTIPRIAVLVFNGWIFGFIWTIPPSFF